MASAALMARSSFGAGKLFGHQPAAVDAQDDLMVAFGACLAHHQIAHARRALPVDAARVHAGRELAKLVELRSFAAQPHILLATLQRQHLRADRSGQDR
jgi:hypothetical protein